ncbi:MAG TPA: FtsL-like putative cell division protein [Arachidicoccus sp.]|nr:FtsL-like putative cell division protein [Arachidicoccus sp.]
MSDQHEERSKFRTSFKKVVRYDWITKNIGFFLFLAMLTVLYIANGHWADKTIRDISRTSQEIKDLQFEYKTLKSELMYQTRETELVKAVEEEGLKISETPPVHIKLETRKPITDQ